MRTFTLRIIYLSVFISFIACNHATSDKGSTVTETVMISKADNGDVQEEQNPGLLAKNHLSTWKSYMNDDREL